MPKTRKQKEEILSKITEKIKKSKSVYFTRYSKLTVSENESLRVELEKENSEYIVAQKTIAGLAFKKNDIEVDTKKMDGQIAIVFGYQDEVVPARIIDKFRKEHEEKVEFVGAILDGKFIDGAGAMQLASLPSKQELYAKLVGSINAPISGFVNALAGNLKNFVYVLKAIEEKKGA
jgi:large subunit ribosomal protein L10